MLAYLDSTDVKPLDLESFVTTWKDSLSLRVQAGEVKQDTAASYARGLSKFLAWHGSRETSPDAIREWKADLLRQSHKPASVNAWLAGLRSFFGWLAERGAIQFDPAQAIPGAKRKGTRAKHSRECLTDREVIRLLSMPDRYTIEGKRDYAMIAVMLYTAARGIELHRADIEDLKTVDGSLVLYVQGKGHDEKDDFLVLSLEAESAMREWLAVRGKESGALFTSCSNRTNGKRLSRRAIRGIVKGYFDAAGIHGNKTTHSLRHTAITNAIRHNAPLQKVKGMSRHANIDTLLIYYHEVDRLSDPAERYICYE
ncbi:MAG: tyrosine-type recombinase/integrase [Anaerolineales bacterium]|nr:tyrosine-type recombinase/integrase [Anaerolineales bacterium]